MANDNPPPPPRLTHSKRRERVIVRLLSYTMHGEVDDHWKWFLDHRFMSEPDDSLINLWTVTRVLDRDGKYRGSAVAVCYSVYPKNGPFPKKGIA